MNINTAMYLADVCGDVTAVCGVILIIGTIALVILTIIRIAAWDEEEVVTLVHQALRKWPILAVIAVVGCLTPSKNTVYMMVASSYLESSSIPPKVAQALEIKLDKYISDLEEDKD